MAQILPFKLRADAAEQMIREIAEDSRNVIFTAHAKERMEERDILIRDVYRILQSGIVSESPTQERGEWKCKVSKRLRGNREATVVTIIMVNKRLRVVTIMWEDL